MSTLEIVRSSMLYAEDMIRRNNLSEIVWIFCPGQAVVTGNERADVLAGEAVAGEPISLDHPTVMVTLTKWFDNTRVIAPSHTLDIVTEKVCKRGGGRRCDLRGTAKRVSD